jgi:glutamate 5-kinase
MREYQKLFEKHDKLTAQFLLTANDFDSRKRTEFAKQAINVCLKNGVIPIINENDTTATEELVFGDNDRLSAHVAYYFDADMLVLLSDIDGYYDKDPRKDKSAKIKRVVHQISQEELDLKIDPNDTFATGGIVTKLQAADFLLKRGKSMFLSDGFDLKDIKSFLLEGKQTGGTLFCPKDLA